MEEVLMFTDTKRFKQMVANHSVHLGSLNAILAAYEVMNLPQLTGAEFIRLVQQPGTVVFDKMTNGGAVEIMGMQVDKEKAIELILKPSGYDDLIELINVYKKASNWDYHLHKVDVVNGEVVLQQSVIDAETESSKVYAKTDEEKQLFQFVQGVIAAADEAFGEGSPHDLGRLVANTISTLATPTGTFQMPLPNYSYIIDYGKIVGFGSAGFKKFL